MSDKNQKDQKDVLRPHVIDGIQEYDNALPTWWVWLFWGAIVFGIGYFIYYHGMGGQTINEELASHQKYYAELMAKSEGEAAKEMGNAGSLADMAKNPTVVESGKKIFMVNCIGCHGANGEGGIGPNLADDYWIHGGSDEAVLAAVSKGIIEKGMPGWEPVLGASKVKHAAAFILSIRNTFPEGGKEPQGQQMK